MEPASGRQLTERSRRHCLQPYNPACRAAPFLLTSCTLPRLHPGCTMQVLRSAALGRVAAALGSRGSASLAAAGVSAEQAGGAKAHWSELRRALPQLGPFGSGRKEEEGAPEGSRSLHAGEKP